MGTSSPVVALDETTVTPDAAVVSSASTTEPASTGSTTGAPTLLRIATAGSVDDGKSTLVGRLLFDSKSVLSDQLDAVERVSRDKGYEQADLALLTDGLRAEREQGITIDVAYRYFATASRSFILADCPGHVQYTRNMVTGASTADVVVLLVDARKGVLEQTRRHLAVAALLRVPHVVVAVNKIDLVGWSQDRFEEIAADLRAAASALGLGRADGADVHAIPVSALLGDNIVDASGSMPWYEGPTLLDLLEVLPAADATADATEPFRLAVQHVVRPQVLSTTEDRYRDYRGYAGQVAAGVVKPGDEIVVLPSGTRATVAGIDTADSLAAGLDSLPAAFAPQSVTIRLVEDVDVAHGDLLAAAHDAPTPTQDVAATLAWLGDRPLHVRDTVLLRHGTRTVKAQVRAIAGRFDLTTLGTTEAAELVAAPSLELNDLGRVTLRLAAPVPVEPYARARRTGAFLLIDPDDGGTLAAGMVDGS